MKRKKLFVTVTLLLLLIGSIAATSYVMINKQEEEQTQFYVGVTYCGNSVQEAKELIDKVKNCTNLFILQSWPLSWNSTAMDEIGDYVFASNLNYAVSGGTGNTMGLNSWLNTAKEKWGEQFIGVYYNDEPCGKMLDGSVILENTVIQVDGGAQMRSRITKNAGGAIGLDDNGTLHIYYTDGTITSSMSQYNTENSEAPFFIGSTRIMYYPNGTIVVYEDNFDTEKK
ncbi:MAG: hypothetical protein LBC12_04925 [Nitrososphaerota archaeon]|nr:hypothetical protein [Nitrososphaerota archaeon]